LDTSIKNKEGDIMENLGSMLLGFASLVSALITLGGFSFVIFKFLETNKRQDEEIKKNREEYCDIIKKHEGDQIIQFFKIKKEQRVVVNGMRACLDGLHQLSCNGKVTEGINELDNYLNDAAHDID